MTPSTERTKPLRRGPRARPTPPSGQHQRTQRGERARRWTRWLGLVACGTVLTTAASCAFDDGQPWGRVEVDASAQFDVPPERRTPDDALLTNNDYSLALDRLEVEVHSVSMPLTPEGGSSDRATTFDPTDPPAGFSNCHNGHCHADSGELVAYEEIEAMLAGGTGRDAGSVVQTITGAVALGERPQPLPLGPCTRCEIETRGELTNVEADIGVLKFEGLLDDRRTGDARRLPEGGVRVHGELPIEAVLSSSIDVDFGHGEPLGAQIEVTVVLEPGAFDNLPWASWIEPTQTMLDLSSVPTAIEVIRENVATRGHLEVSVERFDAP